MSFENLNLNENLLRAVQACGFTDPSDIQRDAIPVVMQGRDLMASAQTGTGKTAAFVLPALERLSVKPTVHGHGPRVLVLTPTRELATQVSDNIRQLGRFSRITSTSVVGGTPYPPQIRMLSKPLDILVATPGRLMDHMQSGRIDFSRLEMLILDEADRMLDMGFVDDVRTIAAATPKDRQTLLFSATLEGRILDIAREILTEPARIQLAANKDTHASITQQLHQADDIRHKHRLLDHLISDTELQQAVIFTATKRGADQLTEKLEDRGHACASLHGDMNQSKRRRTVDRMRRGQVRLLVATDVAARGLDIRGISHVINFDMPMVAEDYIHRIGRTGRGGSTGTAVSLIGPDDWGKLSGIERLVGRKLEREVIEGLEPQRPEPTARHGRPAGKRNFNGKPGGYRGKNAGKGGYAGKGGNSRSAHKGGQGAANGARSEGQRSEGGYKGKSTGNGNGNKPVAKANASAKAGYKAGYKARTGGAQRRSRPSA